MRISQKADYALRAMLDLALQAREGAPARSAEIARRAKVPEKFLEAILVELRKAGLVQSRRGPEGGHLLARAADAITLGQVLAAIDGPLTLVERGAPRRASSPVETGLRETWEDVERAIGKVLEGVTLEDLRRRALAHERVHDFSI